LPYPLYLIKELKYCAIIPEVTVLKNDQAFVGGDDLSKGSIIKKRVRDADILTKGGHYSHVVEAGGFLFVSGMVSRKDE